MIDAFFYLFKHQRQLSHSTCTNGFTLSELLIATSIAGVITTALFGLVLNIINNERQEQAKTTSEQEVQLALDYITQDLEQAIYIYNADGLNKTSNDTPAGIKDQIPPLAAAPGCQTTIVCVPVLVFWKRELKQDVIPVNNSTAKDDAFVYSLVSYYLVVGNTSSETWSDVARISRFQIRDGVKNSTNQNTYIIGETPSSGFQLFDLKMTGTTFKDKMNSWLKKTGENYTDSAWTLVDFIDKSTNSVQPSCPLDSQQVPSTLVGGFYACVNSAKTWAQIYIRGNALARIEDDSVYTTARSSYFPTAKLRVQGRGWSGN